MKLLLPLLLSFNLTAGPVGIVNISWRDDFTWQQKAQIYGQTAWHKDNRGFVLTTIGLIVGIFITGYYCGKWANKK